MTLARETLLAAGPDLLACETLPSLLEARAVLRALREHPDARAWLIFIRAVVDSALESP